MLARGAKWPERKSLYDELPALTDGLADSLAKGGEELLGKYPSRFAWSHALPPSLEPRPNCLSVLSAAPTPNEWSSGRVLFFCLSVSRTHDRDRQSDRQKPTVRLLCLMEQSREEEEEEEPGGGPTD